MKTAGQKKRKRGGHNKRDDVPRYPNGRINYTEMAAAEDIVATAREARQRLFGIAANDAVSAHAGSVFGRMYLQGEFGPTKAKDGHAEAIYVAGMEFAKRRQAYLSAIAAPSGPRSGSDLSGGGRHIGADLNSQEYVEKCARSRQRFSEIRRVCLDADPLSIMALEAIVCDDKMVASLVGPLRIACNAIHRELVSQKRR
jgi:hypothetical protein